MGRGEGRGGSMKSITLNAKSEMRATDLGGAAFLGWGYTSLAMMGIHEKER